MRRNNKKFSTRMKAGAGITAAVITAVGAFEGLRLQAYRDAVGIPTICFGETKGVRMGQKHTRKECESMLRDSLIRHESGMAKCMDSPHKIPDKTYGAFLSFTYNVGVGAYCRSTLAKKANRGDLKGACNELPKWNKAGGRVLKGLTRRRAEERQMCLEGLKE